MNKIYIDTSDAGEVKQEKLDDRVTIGYGENGEIVGVEIHNPLGLDIDDDKVLVYETENCILTKTGWGET